MSYEKRSYDTTLDTEGDGFAFLTILYLIKLDLKVSSTNPGLAGELLGLSDISSWDRHVDLYHTYLAGIHSTVFRALCRFDSCW